MTGYFYHDLKRETEERSDLHRRIRGKRDQIEKLHMIEDQNGKLTEVERTKKQKDILEALNKILWW